MNTDTIQNTETSLLLRNVQDANRQLMRAEKELADAPSVRVAQEIIDDHRHIADWVGEAQTELGERCVPMSLWDAPVGTK